jgi:hypothetical protein
MLEVVKVKVHREPTAKDIAEREAEWLRMIEAGEFEITWFEFPSGLQFSSALKLPIGKDGAMKRVAMRYHTARKALQLLGAQLPSKEQAEEMFRESQHIAPVVSRPMWGGSPTSASIESMIAISDRIDALAGPVQEKPLDNDGKLWLRGAHPDECINFGFVDIPDARHPNIPPKRANGLHMWQDVGRAHDYPGTDNDNHVDGTQFVRGVRYRVGFTDTDNDYLLDAPRSYLGERSIRVRDWQRLLQQLAEEHKDSRLHPGNADGAHGPLTEAATLHFLSGGWRDVPSRYDYEAPLTEPPPDEPVYDDDDDDGDTDAGLPFEFPPETFVQARIGNYRTGRHDPSTGEAITYPTKIVIHCAQIKEVMGAAESLAAWTARDDIKVSWHYAIDADSAVSSVLWQDTAFAAPGANHDGMHYELSGYAEQRAKEWHDEYSTRTIDNAAKIVARDCLDFLIPIKRLSVKELKAGESGICGHADVSKAFKKSSHTDPGKHFPWDEFMALVSSYAEALSARE